NNQLKLNNDIIMTIYNDTPLYLYTNELFFDGNNIVENKVNNTFRYDIYTVFSQGLNFNTNNNNLRLLNNVHIADKFGNNLFANNGFIDISKNYIRLNELKKGNYNNYNVFADYCELRNNQIILVGNVKIFNGQFALNADTIIYDTVKKQVSILSNFKIDSDTFLYTGSNIIINLKNQSGFSKNIGELTLKNPNIKMLFGEFFFDTPLLTLEKNIKINNDTYMLTTNELKIKINNFQTIDKIYSDTICDFVENTMFRKIFTCGFFVEFANNNSPIRLKLLDKVKIQNYEHILEAQSGIIDFADNIIKTAKFQKNVKYNFNDYKLESDILNADFNNGNLQSIKIDSGIAVVESDTYQITSNNLKIDFLTSNKMNFQNSDFYCELLNNFTIKNKINNSFINSNRGNFTYLNNKIDNLKFSGAINGLILNN
ncbi:MAG TPA: hypothetical protein PLM75_08490, partial [bacterium]|nr:hypothetical protein [bacterium]